MEMQFESYHKRKIIERDRSQSSCEDWQVITELLFCQTKVLQCWEKTRTERGIGLEQCDQVFHTHLMNQFHLTHTSWLLSWTSSGSRFRISFWTGSEQIYYSVQGAISTANVSKRPETNVEQSDTKSNQRNWFRRSIMMQSRLTSSSECSVTFERRYLIIADCNKSTRMRRWHTLSWLKEEKAISIDHPSFLYQTIIRHICNIDRLDESL